ncbi:MAG: c-type cytochrome, partial [Planctomycetia bacterium]|nr:c-type cytochrome [Planctomycetia bacterium]
MLLAGCGAPDPNHRHVLPQDVTDFSKLFATHCAGCHGQDGTQGPAPPLNEPLFLALTSDEQLKDVIDGGRHGTLMPAFGDQRGGPLTAKQVGIVVKGLRGWKQADPAQVQSLREETKPGNRDRGEILFAKACAGCHGDQGKGKDSPAGAVNQSAFLALVSEDFLRRIVITGRPDLKRKLSDG